jgi:hypothetical protein
LGTGLARILVFWLRGIASMDIKKIGIIALVVLGVIAAGFSFKSAFMTGASDPNPSDGQAMAEKMKAGYAKMRQQGTGVSGGAQAQ